MSTHDDLIGRRRRSLGSSYRLFYERPVELVRGEGTWLFDAEGQRYLDVYNNVPHVGHCHPTVVKAVADQLATLNTHTRYLHEGIVRCAERMNSLMPDGIDRTLFACSGTEAVELGLRLARAWSGQEGIICTRFAYHGNSAAVAQISPEERGGRPGPHVEAVTIRPARGFDDADAAQQLLDDLERAIGALAARGFGVAAFIVDTILSSEGIGRAPPGSLQRVAERVREAGGLFIADEVQAGFGRLGTAFWGFDWQGVEPDVVTMGKPMGNGYPVSAVSTRAEIIDRFTSSAGYFNTFGGSPVAAAAVNAVLDVLESERLPERAESLGHDLRAGLRALQGRFEVIREVRGGGLFSGVELCGADPGSDAQLATRVVNALRDRRVLVGRTGTRENVLKLRPPLAFGAEHAELLIETLEDVLAKL